MPARRGRGRDQASTEGADEQSAADGTDSRRLAAATTAARMTVNIGPATAEALQMVVDHENVTITEAVRRLIAYGELIYRTVKVEKKDVLIRDGNETQLVLLA